MSLFGSYNHITVMGNMTRDVELRNAGETKVCDITVAVNESVKRGDKWEDDTTFVDCTLWGKTAELAQRFGGKGKTVLVSGRLKMDKWQDKATGENRSKLKVVADSITFCGDREPTGGNADSGQRQERKGGKRTTAQNYQPKRGEDSGGYAQDMDSEF